jgi:hypothetical protein
MRLVTDTSTNEDWPTEGKPKPDSEIRLERAGTHIYIYIYIYSRLGDRIFMYNIYIYIYIYIYTILSITLGSGHLVVSKSSPNIQEFEDIVKNLAETHSEKLKYQQEMLSCSLARKCN